MTKSQLRKQRDWLCGLGLFLVFGSRTYLHSPEAKPESLQLALIAGQILGLIVFVFGCRAYALYKGRSPWLGLLGLIGLVGYVIIACIPEYRKPVQPDFAGDYPRPIE